MMINLIIGPIEYKAVGKPKSAEDLIIEQAILKGLTPDFDSVQSCDNYIYLYCKQGLWLRMYK